LQLAIEQRLVSRQLVMIDLQDIHAAKQEAGIVRIASPLRDFTAWRCFNKGFCHCRPPYKWIRALFFSALIAKPIDPDQNSIAERRGD
jgi:hypothetical protein